MPKVSFLFNIFQICYNYMGVNMNVKLHKNGETLTYAAGPALYILVTLIPMIGGLLYIIMSILRRQFKGMVLNSWVLQLLLILTLVGCIILGSLMNQLSTILGMTMVVFGYLVYLVASIYLLVYYMRFSNYLSVKARIADGYEVVNIDEPVVAEFVEKSNEINVAKFQIVKF